MMNGASWKTSLYGIGMLIGALAIFGALMFDKTPLPTTVEVMIAGGGISLLSGGLGLLNAKDRNVTGAGWDATTIKK